MKKLLYYFKNLCNNLYSDDVLSRSEICFVLCFAVILPLINFLIYFVQGLEFGSAHVNLFLLDFCALALFGVLIFFRFVLALKMRKLGVAGSSLYLRIVGLFGFFTLIPAIILFVFAVIFFNVSLGFWPESRIKTLLGNSVKISEDYLFAHGTAISTEAIAIADNLEAKFGPSFSDDSALRIFANKSMADYDLYCFAIFTPNDTMLSIGPKCEDRISRIPLHVYRHAESGRRAVFLDKQVGISSVLVMLQRNPIFYLMISTQMSSNVIRNVNLIRSVNADYDARFSGTIALQLHFVILCGITFLWMFMLIMWVGLMIASDIVLPLSKIFDVVNVGCNYRDLLELTSSRGHVSSEVAMLIKFFNDIIIHLRQSRAQLSSARQDVDELQSTLDLVLDRISSCVLFVSDNKEICSFNRSASSLFVLQDTDLGKKLSVVLPEFTELLNAGEFRGTPVLIRGGRYLFVSVQVVLVDSKSQSSYLLICENNSDSVYKQGFVSWFDISKQVTHEVRNAITPIKLAASQLKSKYCKDLQVEKQETITKYIDLIIKYSGTIGRVIGEFIKFARMPAPNFVRCNLGILVIDVVFSCQFGSEFVDYQLLNFEENACILADEDLIIMVLLNLFRNSAEAISSSGVSNGKISVSMEVSENYIYLKIQDNGSGIKHDMRGNFSDPYVTTSLSGLGVGLSVVKKILEDHGATISFYNLESGCLVTLRFKRYFFD